MVPWDRFSCSYRALNVHEARVDGLRFKGVLGLVRALQGRAVELFVLTTLNGLGFGNPQAPSPFALCL